MHRKCCSAAITKKHTRTHAPHQYTHINTHTHMRARAHIHTRARARAHTQTHKHTHTHCINRSNSNWIGSHCVTHCEAKAIVNNQFKYTSLSIWLTFSSTHCVMSHSDCFASLSLNRCNGASILVGCFVLAWIFFCKFVSLFARLTS